MCVCRFFFFSLFEGEIIRDWVYYVYLMGGWGLESWKALIIDNDIDEMAKFQVASHLEVIHKNLIRSLPWWSLVKNVVILWLQCEREGFEICWSTTTFTFRHVRIALKKACGFSYKVRINGGFKSISSYLASNKTFTLHLWRI